MPSPPPCYVCDPQLTAWEGLFESLGLRAFDFSIAGKSLLVVPGAGGVGSFVIQLAKKLLGLTVIATASRPESIAACLELGADFTINHREVCSASAAAAVMVFPLAVVACVCICVLVSVCVLLLYMYVL